MPDVWTVRLQGGRFGSERGFFSFSPELRHGDALFAYEGSHTDGPFQSPLRYPLQGERFACRSLDQRQLGGWKTVAVAANRRVSVAPHQVMMLPRRIGSEGPVRDFRHCRRSQRFFHA